MLYDGSGNPTTLAPGTAGQVLTSTGAGEPAYQDVTQAHGIPNFIQPVTLAQGSATSAAIPWTTISSLQAYVPATATALILSGRIVNTGGSAEFQMLMRPDDTGVSRRLNSIVSGHGGDPIASFCQAIVPFKNTAGVVSFDYSTNWAAGDGGYNWDITLEGYIS